MHACLHTVEGLFARVTATSAGTSGSIDRAHTSYRVELAGRDDEDAAGGALRFPVPGDVGSARVAFFVEQFVPLRLRTSSGETLEPNRVQRVAGCPRIRWYVQFEVDSGAGELRLELGPSSVANVSLVCERGWIVAPE